MLAAVFTAVSGLYCQGCNEGHTAKQLKGFCRDMGEDADEEGPEDDHSENFLPSEDDVTTAVLPPAKPGSSVSDQGLTAEERREEREFQLQMARLQIEAQQEERRAETKAKQTEAERAAKQIEAERAEVAAESALAEKKVLLAHQLSLKQLEIKARQS
ncbi:hypothetical protein NDU88_002888 [Pleurodeles waltl]|uniref:Uncharacterized protein n=1 Tax=Pleurodeles waltl TaxID=8319 RepID=A0AAV7MSZ4_PLEWA|nr:hypothetical protein NDU88_002888 [Pleurodeles waltl]